MPKIGIIFSSLQCVLSNYFTRTFRSTYFALMPPFLNLSLHFNTSPLLTSLSSLHSLQLLPFLPLICLRPPLSLLRLLRRSCLETNYTFKCRYTFPCFCLGSPKRPVWNTWHLPDVCHCVCKISSVKRHYVYGKGSF